MRDCVEEAGAVGALWVQLRVSLLDPGSGSGDETGLAWLSALVPKPLRENCRLRESGSWGKGEQGRAGSAGLARLCQAALHGELAEPL